MLIIYIALAGMTISAVMAVVDQDWSEVIGWACGLSWCVNYMFAYRKKWDR